MVNVKKIIKIIVIVSFCILAFALAQYHEPWSDEAQSFLIARDTTLSELFGVMKYEGTPPLWVLLIKLFLFMGGTYETFFLVSLIPTIIGIIIFELKVKAPIYIKILFPFTYFIFYQNTIVSRSYCLVFPALMLLALIYEKRFEKPIIYSLVLLFIMGISLHMLVIAGSLYLIFLIDIIKEKKYKSTKIILSIIIIFVELLIATIWTFPASDCSFGGNGGRPLYYIISEATIGSNMGIILEIMVSCAICSMLFLVLMKDSLLDIIKFLILVFPVIIVLNIITYQGWHVGIIWLVLFTYFIIKDKINNDNLIKTFVVIVCIMQLYWTINTSIYEINHKYSASEDVANFIKELDYENLEIYGLGYYVTGIQPYFEKNIFDNYCTDKAYKIWKFDNGYLSDEETINDNADVYIVSKFGVSQEIVSQIELKENYDKYEFNGYTYIKDKVFEPEAFWIYVKK